MHLSRRAGLLGAAALFVPLPSVALDVGVYVADGQTQLGPFFDEAEIKKHIRSRTEAATTLVWHEGMPTWQPAKDVPVLAAMIAALPLESPFDAKSFLVGTWRSDNHRFEVEGSLLIGTAAFVFSESGKVTTQHRAEWINRIRKLVKPGEVKRDGATEHTTIIPPVYEWEDNSILYSATGDGTYSASGSERSNVVLSLDLTLRKTVNGKPEPADTVQVKETLSIASDREFTLAGNSAVFLRQ